MFRTPLRNLFILFPLMAAAVVGQTAPSDESAADKFRLGIEFLKAKNYVSALEAFQSSARLEPKSAPTHGNIGFSLLALKRPEEAATAFREAIKLAPRDGSFHTALCRALTVSRKHEEAIRSCEEGVRLDPDSSRAQAALLTALRAAGKPDAELITAISAALIRFRDSRDVLEVAAESYSWQRNRQMAVELWEQLLRQDPNSAYYEARFALACLDVEREPEAIAAARRALEIEPNNPFAHFCMGRLFLELGQHADAANAFNVARTRKDELPDAEYYFAVSENGAGRTQSAIQALRNVIRDNPDDFRSLYALGRALSSTGAYEEAIPPLRHAVELDPEDFDAKVALGLVLFESARLTEAIPVLEQADRMKPGNDVVAMFLRVTRARQQGIPQIEEMKRSAKENPDDIDIRVQLIKLLSFARRIKEAEPFVKEVLALKPKDVKVYQWIAVAYSTAGENDKALAIYRKSFEVGEDFGTYMGIAGILASRGQADEASAAYAKMLALKPDGPQSMLLYADHLRNIGRRREALEIYKRSLAISPTYGSTLASAAVLSAKLGEVDAAKTYIATLKTVDPQFAVRLERCLVLLKYLQ
jgi:tetratricopeptide (TPR) repeat protein